MGKMITLFDTSLLMESGMPDRNMEAGLFSVVDMGEDDAMVFEAGRNIILEHPYEHSIYGDIKEPEESDYYLCSKCGERHLRDCFDERPDIVGVKRRVRYFIELPPGNGYARLLVRPDEWVQGYQRLMAPEWLIKNKGEAIWDVGGWFLRCDLGMFGFEIFKTGPILIGKDSSIILTPILSLG